MFSFTLIEMTFFFELKNYKFFLCKIMSCGQDYHMIWGMFLLRSSVLNGVHICNCYKLTIIVASKRVGYILTSGIIA